MWILILIVLSLGIVACFILFRIKNNTQKYLDFLINNSIALKNLLNINTKYSFYEGINFDKSHTYDNNVFYESISCEDYLIYQLQFNKYDVEREIRLIKSNREKYIKYCQEVEEIDNLGQYINHSDKLNERTLLTMERKLFEKYKLKPKIIFCIRIKLYCSKINGEVYDNKNEIFSAEQIIDLIKRINNKCGNFYNDRNIWNAICRVERGKVSNKMRFSIYKRDGYRCRICGKNGNDNDLEIDHIRPIAKGGKTTYDNLQTLCRRCNREKGNKY